ncbi:MAG TPA: MJ0042-type zinc finger domain-containing protein [Gemmataceae bacterium]|nr:MJ0042-type zinc finger domain-containing protein [Gemmataceae bacterium]
MPDITQCPHCQRKLNVPDGQVGAVVRCPACGAEFTAEPFVESRAPIAQEPAPPRPGDPRDRDYPPRGYDDYDRPSRPPPRFDRDYDRPYYDALPHRGSTVQTLGVLCLCFCWAGIPAWVLGIIALVMASTDLSQMDRGQMDPSGRSATKSGQLCAIIGLILSVCLPFTCWCFYFMALTNSFR